MEGSGYDCQWNFISRVKLFSHKTHPGRIISSSGMRQRVCFNVSQRETGGGLGFYLQERLNWISNLGKSLRRDPSSRVFDALRLIHPRWIRKSLFRPLNQSSPLPTRFAIFFLVFFIQRSVRFVAFLSRKKVISYFHRILFSCLHIHPYVCVLNFSSVSSDSQHFHPEQDFKRFTVPRNQFIRILEHRLTDLFTYKKLPLIDETLLA